MEPASQTYAPGECSAEHGFLLWPGPAWRLPKGRESRPGVPSAALPARPAPLASLLGARTLVNSGGLMRPESEGPLSRQRVGAGAAGTRGAGASQSPWDTAR